MLSQFSMFLYLNFLCYHFWYKNIWWYHLYVLILCFNFYGIIFYVIIFHVTIFYVIIFYVLIFILSFFVIILCYYFFSPKMLPSHFCVGVSRGIFCSLAHFLAFIRGGIFSGKPHLHTYKYAVLHQKIRLWSILVFQKG